MSELFTGPELAAYRNRLETLVAELDRLDAMTRESRRPVELDQTAQGRLSRMDAMQVQAMQEATAERRRNERSRALAAIERLDGGDYGWCAACGEAIARKRLDHDPATPHCVACA